jgi:hypothetical protein
MESTCSMVGERETGKARGALAGCPPGLHAAAGRHAHCQLPRAVALSLALAPYRWTSVPPKRQTAPRHAALGSAPPPAPAGRHRALDDVGASVGGYQARGILMALSDMVLKFKAPLRSGDAFRVDTRVEQASGGGAGRRRLTPALTLQSNVPVKRAPRPERRAGDRGAPCTEAGGGEGGTRRQAGGGVRGGAIDRDLPDAGVQADSAACWRPRGVLEAADGRGGGRQWRPLVDGEGQCALWCILQGRRANCTAQVSWAHARAAGRTGAAARPVCNTRSPLVLRRSL